MILDVITLIDLCINPDYTVPDSQVMHYMITGISLKQNQDCASNNDEVASAHSPNNTQSQDNKQKLSKLNTSYRLDNDERTSDDDWLPICR